MSSANGSTVFSRTQSIINAPKIFTMQPDTNSAMKRELDPLESMVTELIEREVAKNLGNPFYSPWQNPRSTREEGHNGQTRKIEPEYTDDDYKLWADIYADRTSLKSGDSRLWSALVQAQASIDQLKSQLAKKNNGKYSSSR